MSGQRANRYEITQAELPLACPRSDQTLWNAHPKVYLPIDSAGEAVCPYCGTVYVLSKGESN